MARNVVYASGKLVPVWDEKEIAVLNELYPRKSINEVSHILGRSHSAIQHKASRLKIRKDSWFVKEVNLNDAEAGYIAGIIDGEGSVRIQKQLHRDRRKSDDYRRFRFVPYVQVANTSKELMNEMRAKIGFGLIFLNRSRGDKWKDCYAFVISTSAKIYPLLKRVSPFLIIKRRHAELLLEFCENRLRRLNQNESYSKRDLELYELLRELNRK